MLEIKSDSMYLNGEKFKLYSGAMHYFRILPQYWEDRFAKLKACGFNAVETVMCWNLHEPKEGCFDFEGMLDIVKFCKMAQKFGLYVIIRPGPYTCAEWDFGGFPAWTLKDKNMQYRCNNDLFMQKVTAYFKEVFKRLLPIEIQNGGNLVALQIENEYGSYGNDKSYLMALEKTMRDCGSKLPFFTSDGNWCNMLSGGTLPHIYTTLNFGSHASTAFNCLKKIQPNLPKTCMEFWCGWFDHWGEVHHKRNSMQVAHEVQSLIDNDTNLNIYMFHGGTNFNFWAGANFDYKYKPTVTSYDDAALLNEYGDYTPAYHKVREVLHKARGLKLDTLPPSPVLQNIGEIALISKADLWQNLYILGEKHTTSHPESMEYFGQNFGYILYAKTLKGKYDSQLLVVEGVSDIAYLRVNGVLVKKYDRTKNVQKKYAEGFAYKLPSFDGECKIEIFVEGMGRVNYGLRLVDPKGIKRVRLGMQLMFEWDVYTLPIDNIQKVDYSVEPKVGSPAILKGQFFADIDKDCFIDMKGFAKGIVFINGFNIGRYWNRGPQRTLYIPAPLLKATNEVVVFEQESYKKPVVKIIDKHLL